MPTMIKIKVKEKNKLYKRKRDNYARKWGKQRLINYLRDELRGSTTHGIPYIVNTEIHWFERLFWAVNCLSCSGLVFYLLSSQYSRFIVTMMDDSDDNAEPQRDDRRRSVKEVHQDPQLREINRSRRSRSRSVVFGVRNWHEETPIVMSVEMDYFNWNVSYPAFTLCPYFKPDLDFFQEFLNDSNEKMGQNMDRYLWGIISFNMDTLDLAELHVGEVSNLIDTREYTAIAAQVFRKFPNSSMTTNTNWPLSVEPVMTEIGMCHTINSNVAHYHNPNKWTNGVIAEPYVKSSVLLSVHDRDFFTQILDYADVYKIFIHSPDEIILDTTPSYTQSDRGFLSFGVQVWTETISEELRILPIRLRKCRFIDEPISKRYIIYSYNHCILECKIQMILKVCGCIPHIYKALGNEKICYIDKLKCFIKHSKEFRTLSASEETLKSFSNKGLPRSPRDCACLSSCETTQYTKDYETFLGQPMNRLRIGISSFPKTRILREVIFSFYDIILKSGGVINLCIGASIISMFEFIFTIIRIPIYLIVQEFKKRLFLNGK